MRRRTRSHLRAALPLLAWVTAPALIVLTTHTVWAIAAKHRLATAKATLHARGVGSPETLPAADDPFNRVLEAADRLHASHTEWEWFEDDRPSSRYWTASERERVRTLLRQNAPVLQQIEEALARPFRPWASDDCPPGFRRIANLLSAQALLDHGDGHEANALARLQSTVALANLVDRRNTMSHLLACAIRREAAETVERIEPTLHLSATDGTTRRAGELLSVLNAAPALHEALWQTFESDAAQLPQSLRRDGQVADNWLTSPLLDSETARLLALMLDDAPAYRATDWPAAAATFRSPGSWRMGDEIDAFAHALSNDWYGSPESPVRIHFSASVDQSAAATLLAARLFAAAHGNLPPQAQALVPEFLPSLPADPFSPTHEPLRFRLDPAGVTVWSVATNGVDDAAEVDFDSDGNRKRRIAGGRSDYQRDLVYGAAWRTAIAPNTITPPREAPAPATLPAQ